MKRAVHSSASPVSEVGVFRTPFREALPPSTGSRATDTAPSPLLPIYGAKVAKPHTLRPPKSNLESKKYGF